MDQGGRMQLQHDARPRSRETLVHVLTSHPVQWHFSLASHAALHLGLCQDIIDIFCVESAGKAWRNCFLKSKSQTRSLKPKSQFYFALLFFWFFFVFLWLLFLFCYSSDIFVLTFITLTSVPYSSCSNTYSQCFHSVPSVCKHLTHGSVQVFFKRLRAISEHVKG